MYVECNKEAIESAYSNWIANLMLEIRFLESQENWRVTVMDIARRWQWIKLIGNMQPPLLIAFPFQKTERGMKLISLHCGLDFPLLTE